MIIDGVEKNDLSFVKAGTINNVRFETSADYVAQKAGEKALRRANFEKLQKYTGVEDCEDASTHGNSHRTPEKYN